ncbi:DUF7768 domain-containing protein [Arcanobacterium canis]
MTATTLDIGIRKKNAEGYLDLTSYHALKKLQREQFGYRPLVYICSLYSGDTEANVVLARQFCAFPVSAGKIPFAPHLHYPQFMDDTDLDQRELAMFMSRVMLAKCEALWVYVGRVSPSMRLEVVWVFFLGVCLVFHYY